MDLQTDYRQSLLGEVKRTSGAARWRAVAAFNGVGFVVVSVLAAWLVHERADLTAQLDQQKEPTTADLSSKDLARPSRGVVAAPASTADKCTTAGHDVFDNNAGKALPCCEGSVIVNSPCRGGDICQYCVPRADPGDACTVAGTDVYDNNLHSPLKCCPGLVEVDTPCRGTDLCKYCQLPSTKQPDSCTPAGTDMMSTGQRLKCCEGLTLTSGPCRGTDVCDFCIPSTLTEGPRAEYPKAKVSIDPATPKEAVDKYKDQGMSLILSDEFKDITRTKSIFVFEDIPYGVPGNTGDVNIASIYASDTVSLLPEGGLRLAAFLAPESEKEFMKGWNGTYNTNWGSDVSLWSWHAPKVTSRRNGRFQYGMIETRIKAPKGYGPWPAAWLNGCYGFIAESSGEFLLQEDYPFLCGQYWPPELDFFEHFSPEHTWYWRPNSMSLHSPNQYVGGGQKMTKQGGYCPTTLAPPGEAWCFGVSGAGHFQEDPTESYHNYAMRWDPDGVDYYMNDVFMQRFTTDQMVMYLNGQLRPIMIPEMPLFLTFNIALVRKGMDLSHMGEGLTDKQNFDPDTGKWKTMAMDVEYVRVYQDDTQGETRGLNPPITYQTKRKLLANRVTCDLVPELRCMVKSGGTEANQVALANTACNKLKALGDDYCDHVDKLCALNNGGNREGAYGMTNVTVAQFANQRLSLDYGVCCIEEDKTCLGSKDPLCAAADKPKCRDTPHTKLPQWLLDSEYYQEPKLMFAKEGYADGLAGTNPAGWKTFGMGLPRPPPPPPYMPGMAPEPLVA